MTHPIGSTPTIVKWVWIKDFGATLLFLCPELGESVAVAVGTLRFEFDSASTPAEAAEAFVRRGAHHNLV